MSFLKKLLKRPNKQKDGSTGSSPRSSPGPRKPRGSLTSDLRSSPAASPKHVAQTTTLNVRTPTSKHVAQVLEGLLLGSQEIAQDLSALEKLKVTHILNVTQEIPDHFAAKFKYKRISITDMPSTPIAQHFDVCYQFIQEARDCRGTCLVHCYYGASRSASIVIAYLMTTERMRFKEALGYLQMLNPMVNPNDGFEKQLRQLDEKLFHQPREHVRHSSPRHHQRHSSGSSTGSASFRELTGTGSPIHSTATRQSSSATASPVTSKPVVCEPCTNGDVHSSPHTPQAVMATGNEQTKAAVKNASPSIVRRQGPSVHIPHSPLASEPVKPAQCEPAQTEEDICQMKQTVQKHLDTAVRKDSMNDCDMKTDPMVSAWSPGSQTPPNNNKHSEFKQRPVSPRQPPHTGNVVETSVVTQTYTGTIQNDDSNNNIDTT